VPWGNSVLHVGYLCWRAELCEAFFFQMKRLLEVRHPRHSMTTRLEDYLLQKLKFSTALTRLIRQPEATRAQQGTLHTPQEILQQPWTWLETAQRIKAQARDLDRFLRKAGVNRTPFSSRVKIVLVGAGTSDYVGKSVLCLLRRRLQTEVSAVPSTDILTNSADIFLPRVSYLMVSFSRSGESPEGVESIEIARRYFPSVSHLIVTCNENGRMARSSIGRKAAYVLVLNEAVHDKGLAMTSSYSNMVVAGLALAYLDEMQIFLRQIELLSAAGEKILSKYADLASQLSGHGFKRFCFLGTGNLSGAAWEAQLKLRELTDGRLVTFSESFLGLRHGPLSGIDRETLLVAFLSRDLSKQRYELDLLREIKAKKIGSAQCVVCERVPKGQKALAHHWIEFKTPGSEGLLDGFRPPLDVLFAQLLGVFSSLRYRLRPDQPSRRGVISRVVQGVRIYPDESA
jgi:D-galactosamine 6-phosphate deaminase/isomerase